MSQAPILIILFLLFAVLLYEGFLLYNLRSQSDQLRDQYAQENNKTENDENDKRIKEIENSMIKLKEQVNGQYDELKDMFTSYINKTEYEKEASILMFGGIYSNANYVSDEISRYNMKSHHWSTIGHMTGKRYGLEAVKYGNEVYLLGGYINGKYLTTLQAYNPMQNQWKDKSPMFTARW